MKFLIGTRVTVKEDTRVIRAVHGVSGTIAAIELFPGEREYQCWVQFDAPVKHFEHGELIGLWLWESALS